MLLKQGFYWIVIHLGYTCRHTWWSLWFCRKTTHFFISVNVTKFTMEREKSVPTNVTTSTMWPHCIGDPCLALRTYSRLRHLSAYCLYSPQILHLPQFTSHEAHSVFLRVNVLYLWKVIFAPINQPGASLCSLGMYSQSDHWWRTCIPSRTRLRRESKPANRSTPLPRSFLVLYAYHRPRSVTSAFSACPQERDSAVLAHS